MDFGMPYLLETETIESCLTLCRSLGLQFIEFNMNFPQCQISYLNSESLNYYLRKENLYYTLHLDESFNVFDFNDKVRDAYLSTFCDAVAWAKEVEAPVINMHLAKGIYITLPDRKEYLFQRYQEHFFKRIMEFRQLCQSLLKDTDIVIAIENTNGFAEHEQAAIEMLLECDCFRLTLDIGHSHVANDVDIPFYEKHFTKLGHMHAHDAKGKNCHLAFGDGEIDLKQRICMAQRANARVVLETKTVESLTKTVKYKDTFTIGDKSCQ